MRKIYLLLTLLIVFMFAFAGGDGSKVARVQIAKGKAVIIKVDGTNTPVKTGLWVEQGSVIKTESASFVKLSFIDKSTMNVGPNSEMKIEKFSKDEAGVINVISGKIRAKVSKDYLQMEKDKSKLFVKSKSAVMGIRGTDFAFTTNKKTGATTAVLFEGSVVFNKISAQNFKKDLESIVNEGRRISPGQFSIARKDLAKATVPAKMSTKQIKALEKNETFSQSTVSTAKAKPVKSIVPPGLTGDIVTNSNESLTKGIKKAIQVDVVAQKVEVKIDTASKGFSNGDEIKPVDGSIVHIDSGTVIPIGNDAVFDSNAGEWVSNSVGTVGADGSYVPPETYSITDEGKLLKEVDGTPQVVNTDITSLDDTPALQDLATTVDTNSTETVGKEPAGTLDESTNSDDAQDAADSEDTSANKTSSTDDKLAAPPIPQDTTYMPPTYYQSDPSSVTNPTNQNSRTPVSIQINQGQ